jgi:sugar phosphate isomerase/epimerase
MKLSLTSWSFPACTLAEASGITRALGISAMDLGLLHGAALDRQAVLRAPEETAGKLRSKDIQVANVYWLFGNDVADRAVSDPRARDQNLADLEKVARFAKSIGAPTLFVLPGVMRPGERHSALFDQSAATLRAMLPIAASHGVTLTVEPHIGGLLSSPDLTLALIDQVPGLKLTLDYAHFACMGFTQDQVDRLAPHAAHVHLRQAKPGALQTKWGMGTLDFAAMFDTLNDVDYAGYLSIEYVHQGYMDTLSDDVLTETIRMRDLAHSYGIY